MEYSRIQASDRKARQQRQAQADRGILQSHADGDSNDEANPNGSINNIAGILNERGNVLGMMPHPERYADKALGCDDGMAIFQSIANAMRIAMPL